MDYPDPGFFRVVDGTKLGFSAVVYNLPFVVSVGVDSGQDLHQSRFSCAVFTTECVDLASANVEVHVFQDFHRAKALANVLHFQDVVSHYIANPVGFISCAWPRACTRGQAQ